MERLLLLWSSGKDSAWVALVTSFDSVADRVAMHAVRRTLVEAQADRVGLPLWSVELPSPCSNVIREYRERHLRGTGLASLFPIWGLPNRPLALEMIAAGVKAWLAALLVVTPIPEP